VREVVKYVTKAPDALTPEQVDALGRATRGRRLVADSLRRAGLSDTLGYRSTRPHAL
jgi:hypothetical protein